MPTIAETADYSRSLADLLEEAKRIARDVGRPRAEREDAEGKWPEAGMRALQESRLIALQVPVELGGHGLGLEALAAISEVLSRESPSLGPCFAMHCVGTACIAAKATDFHRERYLVPIAGDDTRRRTGLQSEQQARPPAARFEGRGCDGAYFNHILRTWMGRALLGQPLL